MINRTILSKHFFFFLSAVDISVWYFSLLYSVMDVLASMPTHVSMHTHTHAHTEKCNHAEPNRKCSYFDDRIREIYECICWLSGSVPFIQIHNDLIRIDFDWLFCWHFFFAADMSCLEWANYTINGSILCWGSWRVVIDDLWWNVARWRDTQKCQHFAVLGRWRKCFKYAFGEMAF